MVAVTQIINGETYIQIESNTVVSPGSPPPDIDTDFHTEHRDDAFKHVAELYGEDHVARLPTPTKSSRLGRLSRMPPAFMTLLRQVKSDATTRFREVTSASEGVKPISCAQALEGRGVHACGLLISNHPPAPPHPRRVSIKVT